MDTIWLSTSALRAFWDEHPTWVLALTARNFNFLTHDDNNPSWRRPSIRARLSRSLVSDYKEDRYVEEGLHFEQFFGADFAKHFTNGVVPDACRDDDIAEFARVYSQVTGRTISVTHQQGGDPDTATFDVLGYWRDGVNACEVYRAQVESAITLPSMGEQMRCKLAMALMHLGSSHNWQSFVDVGSLYIYGSPLPARRVAFLKKQGFEGVRFLLADAERVLAKQFTEFANMPVGTASSHLS